MNVVLLIVLLCAAAARVTRLLVVDSFPPIEAAREAVLNRWPTSSWQGYLATCPWCLGAWVAGLLVVAADWRYDVPAPLLVWPTVAWAAGLLVWGEQRLDELTDLPEPRPAPQLPTYLDEE